MRHLRFLLALAPLLFCSLGCSDQEQERGPEEAVRQFLTHMQQLHGHAHLSEQVYQSLWRPAREHLTERARRASALSGRAIEPEEMIAPSRFALHFEPESFQVRQTGKRAQVVILGNAGEQAQTRCFLEDDGWKIALEMPPLPPIRAR